MLTIHHQPPTFTARDAERVAYERYGLNASATLFPGEHDQNFSLKSAAGAQFLIAGLDIVLDEDAVSL